MIFSPDDFARDHFALFGLPRRQALDETELERQYRDVQARVHPDKHTHLTEADQRLAMQWATRTNEAYATLKSPLKRAVYLLCLLGHDLHAERNTAMPAGFLIEQIGLREAVAEARGASGIGELERLRRQMQTEMSNQYQRLTQAMDEAHDYERAAGIARELMFQEKLIYEIDEALEAVEANA